MKNLQTDNAPIQSLPPEAYVTTEEGVSADLAGYNGATFLVDCGVVTDALHTITFEECNTTDGTFSTIATTDLVGDNTGGVTCATNVDEFIGLTDYYGNKRYVRALLTVTDNPSSGGVFGVSILRNHARHKPAGDTQTP